MSGKTRAAAIAAIKAGGPVDLELIAAFPDIVMLRDNAVVEDWLLSLLRKPGPIDGPRCVIANNKPYYVSRLSAGPLVVEVEYYNRHGVRKPVYNPYAADAEAHAAALAMLQRVQHFLREPLAYRDWLCAEGAVVAPPMAVQVRESPVAARLLRELTAAAAPPVRDEKNEDDGVRIVRKPARRRVTI